MPIASAFSIRPTEARQAGFRACKRCRPDTVGLAQPGIDAVRRASAYLATHADQTVTLDHLARVASMSPHHLQRRFKAIVGLSPREFQSAVRAGKLRTSLRDGRDVTTAIYEAGYGSPSRVYEAAPTGKGMSLSTLSARRRRHADRLLDGGEPGRSGAGRGDRTTACAR